MKRRVLLLLILLVVSCETTPVAPKHKIDYFGNNTFHWANHKGLGLVSYSAGAHPSIRSDGAFTQREVQLGLVDEAGEVLPEIYQPLAGDSLEVSFATFAEDGKLTLTRYHCGLPYVRDFVEARSDGLEVVDHERLPVPEANPEDVLNFGQRYFDQAQGVDLNDAKNRFFKAGAKYPKLAVQFLRKLDNQAETVRDPALAMEILNYRDRFELLEDLQLATAD